MNVHHTSAKTRNHPDGCGPLLGRGSGMQHDRNLKIAQNVTAIFRYSDIRLAKSARKRTYNTS